MASNIAVDSQSESFVDAPGTAPLTFLSGPINNDTSLSSLTRPMAAAIYARSLFAHPGYWGHQPFNHFGDVQDDPRGEHVESEEWSALVRSLLSSYAATAGRDLFAWFDRPGYAGQQPRQALDVEHAQPGQYVERQEWPTAMWSLLSSHVASAVPDALSWFGQPGYAGQQPRQALDVEHAQPGQYVERQEWPTAMWSLLSSRAARAVPNAFSWFGQPGYAGQQPRQAPDVEHGQPGQYVERQEWPTVMWSLSSRAARAVPNAFSWFGQPGYAGQQRRVQALEVEHAQPDPLFVFLGPRSPTPLVARNQELLETLDHLGESGDSYVYPGGQTPNDEAFNDARKFVESLPRLRLVPKIVLIVDGEVNFSWDTDGIHIDLGFHGDGEGGSYFAKDESGIKYYCDSFAPDELPDEILRLII